MTVTATTTADDPTTTVADDFTVYDDVTSTVTTTTTIVTEVDYPTDAASVGGYPMGSASTPTAPPADSRYNYHKRHCTLSNFGADRSERMVVHFPDGGVDVSFKFLGNRLMDFCESSCTGGTM
jgi:hypothetical protein